MSIMKKVQEEILLNAAATVHDYVSSNGYYYSLGGDLPGNISGVKNTRAICCATFVSWTLYESGYDWMEECPNINYCGELLPFLESHGGTKIMNPTMDKFATRRYIILRWRWFSSYRYIYR